MKMNEALKQKLFPKKILIAGPYVGEFGHELMDWQEYIRARKKFYKKVYVITYPGRDILYEGCIVHEHKIKLEEAGYYYGNLNRNELEQYAKSFAKEFGISEYDIFNTSMLSNRFMKKIFWKKEHQKFYQPSKNEMKELAFHFRNINKVGPDKSKNFSLKLAQELYDLCIANNYKVRCIGHPAYSFCPEGCEDNRSIDLSATVAAICATKLVVGELSGPLHLANYCAKPTLIWAPGRWRIENCFRNNPFKVHISVVSDNTTNPSPQMIFESIEKTIRCVS